MSYFRNKMEQLSELINKSDFSIRDASEVLKLIGIDICTDFLTDVKLYSEYLPLAEEQQLYNEKLRMLHFIWDSFDKSHYSLAANFAIPFRRELAKQMFKKCGDNFICESGVTFNFPQKIFVGNDVFINRGVYIDSKGGVEIGNSVAITESVMIFTHSHSEAKHSERAYAPVIIKDYAKIYSKAVILPGVTIGNEAIVGGCAVVSKNVPDGELHAGIPAKFLRKREQKNFHGKDLEHIWLHKGAFQYSVEESLKVTM